MSTRSFFDSIYSLEEVRAFRGRTNFLFLLVLLCSLLVQIAFWLANLNCIDTTSQMVAGETIGVNVSAAVAAYPNASGYPTTTGPQKAGTAVRDLLPFTIAKWQLTWALRLVNCILVLATVLYMSLLFGLKVTLVPKLGGVSHIRGAFLLSLIMLILLLPWQGIFGPTVLGAIYTTAELLKATSPPPDTDNIFVMVLHYLRFCGYWFLILLLLLLAQVRSSQWSKAILNQLDV